MNGIGSGRFLAFVLDGNLYAIEVERVEVVLETVAITRVPQAPSHLKGVINYRGAVIPVADLRSRFLSEGEALDITRRPQPPSRESPSRPVEGEAKAELGEENALGDASLSQLALPAAANIVVLHVRYAGEDIVIGILADAVREVVDIDAAHIERAPALGGKGDSSLIAGIGEKDGAFIVILDIDAAFDSERTLLDSQRQAREEQ